MAKVFPPNIYSDPSDPRSFSVSVVDFSPYIYSAPSETQALDVIPVGLILRFVSPVPTIQNIGTIAASVEIYDPAVPGGAVSTDPSDIYEFCLVPQGQAPVAWLSQGTDNSFQGEAPGPVGAREATYTLHARVSRSGSYIGSGISVDVVVDEVAPVTEAIPGPGTYPAGGLNVELRTTDYSTTTIHYTLDGTPVTLGSPTYTGLIPISASTTINALAEDAAGNVESAPRIFAYVVDAVAPNVIIDSISDSNLGIGETAEIVWHVDESCASAVVEIEFLGSRTTFATLGFIEKDVPQITQITSGALSVGSSSVYISAVDLMGNTGTSSAITLFYSTEVPVVTVHEICRQTIAQPDTATIIWSTTIGGAFEVRVGGSNMGEGTIVASGTALPYTIIETPVPHTVLGANIANAVTVYVATPSGNVGDRSAQMSVDTVPPVVSVSHTTADSPFTAPFTLTINATDAPIAGVPIDWETGVSSGTTEIELGDGARWLFKPTIKQQTASSALDGYLYSDPSESMTTTVSVVDFSPYIWSAPSEPQTIIIGESLIISNIRESDKQTDRINILWDTSLAATSKIEYSTDATLFTGVLILENLSLVITHDIQIPGLSEDTIYYYRITSSNGTETSASSILSFRTNAALDSIPPTITNIQIVALSSDSIQVTWDTDELANTIVVYGLLPDLSDGLELPAIQTGGVSGHTYIVSGLASDTRYYFQIKSQDLAGNTTIDPGIITEKTWDGSAPTISNIVIHAYRLVAVIRWQTSESASGLIEYGQTDAYGLTAEPVVAPGAPTPIRTQHEVIITGLTPNRTYHFNLVNIDGSGNRTGIVDRVFDSLSNRDTRVAIYATIGAGTVPSPSNYDYREIGTPVTINIASSTIVNYVAFDGFGNSSGVASQAYAFDTGAPVIDFERFLPEPRHPTGLVIGLDTNAYVRFKVSELVDYQIKNQAGTILASGRMNGNVWLDAPINSAHMLEGDNYITIYVTDLFGRSASRLCGNVIRDTVPPLTMASPLGGYYNSDQYITIVPQSLRPGESVIIYYTIDGTVPTTSSLSALNQARNILINKTTTIRWFSVDDVGNVEPAKFATYFIDTEAPVIQAVPAPGIYDDVLMVELSTNETATIFYTLDGTVPTVDSDIYTGPLEIVTDVEIRCFARDLAGNISDHYLFEYQVKILKDKKFKKVIGFQDKYLLETEFNEAQDNINRRVEEMAHDVVGMACISTGLDILPSAQEGSFEFYIRRGKAYIGGKFITVVRSAQSFVPAPQQNPGEKTFHVIIRPNEPIFRPVRPGQPGWEEGVPEITTYRLEESFVIDAVEKLPDNPETDPYMELYEVYRPATAQSIADCKITDKRHFFEPLCTFQRQTKEAITEMQANMLAMGLELESHKLRNLLGLKNVFVDTFEATKDVNLSLSRGFRYEKTRFEL